MAELLNCTELRFYKCLASEIFSLNISWKKERKREREDKEGKEGGRQELIEKSFIKNSYVQNPNTKSSKYLVFINYTLSLSK